MQLPQFPLFESLEYKDMEGLLKPTIHVDEFAAKMGDDDDIIVISFFVRDLQAAKDLIALVNADWPGAPSHRAKVLKAAKALERAEQATRVQQEQAGFTVSLEFLKRVQESLSDYCGHLDWGNADMELMDEVEAMLAAAPKQGEKP